jgi:hypothetical protein
MHVFPLFILCPLNNPSAADLKYKLQEAQLQHNQYQQQPSYQQGRFVPSGSTSAKCVTSMSPPERPPSSSVYPSPSPPQSQSSIALPRASLNISMDSGDQTLLNTNDELAGYDMSQVAGQQNVKNDPYMDLLFLGWNPDLPEPVILTRLCVCFCMYTRQVLTC